MVSIFAIIIVDMFVQSSVKFNTANENNNHDKYQQPQKSSAKYNQNFIEYIANNVDGKLSFNLIRAPCGSIIVKYLSDPDYGKIYLENEIWDNAADGRTTIKIEKCEKNNGIFSRTNYISIKTTADWNCPPSFSVKIPCSEFYSINNPKIRTKNRKHLSEIVKNSCVYKTAKNIFNKGKQIFKRAWFKRQLKKRLRVLHINIENCDFEELDQYYNEHSIDFIIRHRCM